MPEAKFRSEEQAGPRVRGEPARERAGDHDPLDAEVQHPRPLAQQHAERAQDQRRRDAQNGDPERRRQHQVEHRAHRSLTLYCVSIVATSIVISEIATMTSAM